MDYLKPMSSMDIISSKLAQVINRTDIALSEYVVKLIIDMYFEINSQNVSLPDRPTPDVIYIFFNYLPPVYYKNTHYINHIYLECLSKEYVLFAFQ